MEIRHRHIAPGHRLLAVLLLMFSGMAAHAQDDPTNQQYLFNLLNINPAYAGTQDNISMTVGFRRQWAGIPGAPQTGIFSLDAPLKEHHFGIGGQIYTSSIGKEKTTGLNMSFSTQLKFDEDQFLSLGLQAGLMNYRIDRNSVALPFQDDPAFQTNTNVMLPTAGAGLYYERPRFYASLSAPSLLVGTVKVDKVITVNSPKLSNMQFIFTTGLAANLGEDFQFKPAIYMRFMSGEFKDIHVNGTFWYKDLIGLGASYRYDDAMLGIVELRINDRLRFGYSYGQSIGDKGIFSQGTHEALIRYTFRSQDE